MKKTNELKAWGKLEEHYQNIKNLKLREIFHYDEDRFERFHCELDGLIFDYSKNIFNYDTIGYLQELAAGRKMEFAIRDYFAGKKINHTEGRSVLHTALRAGYEEGELVVDGEDIGKTVSEQLDAMQSIVERFQSGEMKGHTGKQINKIVNIGIGGSDLGPRMISRALSPFAPTGVSIEFVSNVDPSSIRGVLATSDLEKTAFVVCSKTFTTLETMANASTAKKWVQDNLHEDAVGTHFLAVTTNKSAALEFGIKEENIVGFKEWVGGRFSLWSPAGLAMAMYIGWDNFTELLRGAKKADEHFRLTPLTHNIPFLMAGLSIWYSNFFCWGSHAVIPYSDNLEYFPLYLQQLEMESNGKSVDGEGRLLEHHSTPILFGAAGTDAQHSFFQMIHQGTSNIPVDFIVPVSNSTTGPGQLQHDLLAANCFAQSQALMHGLNKDEARELMTSEGLDESEIEKLLPYRIFQGNKPSNTIMLPQVNPYYLGMLTALYEHRTFVLGQFWYVNSFDQYGVELGKKLAKKIIADMGKGKPSADHDASTSGLLERYLSHK
ncbi:MAG: glucose-6-phosphate isomerase [Candidatus Kapaibacteriales bacterium]